MEERVVLLLAGGWTRREVAASCDLDERNDRLAGAAGDKKAGSRLGS
jgi:hypothetical protein